MSIDMYVGASKSQGSSTSALSQSYQAGFDSLQSAVGNFTQDTLLRSQAYDSGKSYFQGVYIPLIQGAILVAEATGKAVEKLPNDYVSQVDSCDLKSSELEAEIQRYETQIQGMQNQIDQVKQLLPVSSERAQHLREASGLIADYTSAKLILERQLQKLITFHAFSSTLFTGVTSLQNAVNQGLAQVTGGKGFDPKTGTFSPKNLKDTRWMITIGNAWDKRQKEIAEINKKARVEREMAALKRAAKVAAADIAMNSFMMNIGLMNMGPSIYGNLKDYGSQKALTAGLRPTGTMKGSSKKVSSVELSQRQQVIQNIKESRKAREASGFGNYLRREREVIKGIENVNGNKGVGNPVEVVGKGSTGRTIPNYLDEQMAMHEVQSNPLQNAKELPIKMTDPRWHFEDGWIKMQKNIRLASGKTVSVHYVYNKNTGAFDDFKFK